jgi:hypothetical protein
VCVGLLDLANLDSGAGLCRQYQRRSEAEFVGEQRRSDGDTEATGHLKMLRDAVWHELSGAVCVDSAAATYVAACDLSASDDGIERGGQNGMVVDLLLTLADVGQEPSEFGCT